MPFTIAHPAAVLPLPPLLGRYGVWSALVIGSMTPDLRWLSLGLLHRYDTHSLAALLQFCLPAGLLCFWLFHRFLRAPLLRALPPAVSGRVPPPFEWRWRALPGVCLSLLVGSATHDLWDGFTHGDSGMARHFPWIRRHVGYFGDYPLYVFDLLQHASTAIGLIVLAVWLARWLRNAPPPTEPPHHSALWNWWALALVVSAAAAAWLAVTLHPVEVQGIRSALRMAKVVALYAFGGVLTWTLLYCVGWHLFANVRSRDPERGGQ